MRGGFVYHFNYKKNAYLQARGQKINRFDKKSTHVKIRV